ncbi:MAG: thioredoxin family protein [Pirellulales bacterium]|nr:thioredoxin family protein [Pirellulales bacterium]
MIRPICLAMVAFTALFVLTPTALALDIGDQGPAWKKLKGTDDKEHSLSDWKDAKAVVVCFTCNHCPIAKMYEDRFIEFVSDYKDNQIAFVAINVNNLEEDKLPAMKERAKEKKFNFTYIYDPSQEIARKYDAKVTPHLFVLDGKRKVAYMGAYDDDNQASKAKKQYLRDAVDAILAGNSPETTTTTARGCSIKYE